MQSQEEQTLNSEIIINSNGAVQLDLGNAAVRVVARDANGYWIFGYN